MLKNVSIDRFQFITDNLESIELACKGGATWIQLRVKEASSQEWLAIAVDAKTICSRFNAKLIINDNVDIAKKIESDGVHLGKSDMDPKEARDILGNDFIIGATANSFEDIVGLKEAPINYIGLGPFRFTSTKKNLSPVLGLDGYAQIIRQMELAEIKIPVIAIGGIIEDDLNSLFDQGVAGVAVSSAINSQSDIVMATQKFLQKLRSL